MESYRETLSNIEQVRSVLGGDCQTIKLPQIVVIGDQSSGKSSLLSTISGISFPEASGITTKCPIVVNTKLNNNHSISYKINDEEIKTDDLEQTILTYQRDLISTSKVSTTPITISAEGNQFTNLVLVDLPGIISNGEGKEEVLTMIKHYIEPNESLILVITPANQDDETARALELAKEYDSEGIRTLRILTKFDKFDSEDNKLKAIDLINNNIHKLSPHAVICRNNGISYDFTVEEQQLNDLELNPERSGIESLKNRLTDLLCELVRINLPGLKEQLQINKIKNINLLKNIGEVEPNVNNIINSLRTKLLDNTKNINIILTPLLRNFQEQIHQTNTLLNIDLINSFYEYNVFEPPFFQGYDTFNRLLCYIVDNWRIIVNNLHCDINEKLNNLIDFKVFNCYSSDLKRIIVSIWTEFINNIINELNDCMNHELEKELNFKTMNHYLTSKYEENMILPTTVIDSICNSFKRDMFIKYDSIDREYVPIDIGQISINIKELIEEKVEEHINDFNTQNIEEQHKLRVLASIRANWAVSHKNLIDNILSVVNNIVINKIKELCNNISSYDIIIQNASENINIKNNRIKYKTEINKMDECLSILNF